MLVVIDVKPMEDMEHITKPEVVARATPRLRQVCIYNTINLNIAVMNLCHNAIILFKLDEL